MLLFRVTSLYFFVIVITQVYSKLHVSRKLYDEFSIANKANICKQYGGVQLFDGATRCRCAEGKTLSSPVDGGALKCRNDGKLCFEKMFIKASS